MEIDGIRLVPLEDGKQGPAIDFKDAIGYDAGNPNGCLTIIGKIEERQPNGKIEDVPIQSKTYAPGTWHHVEVLNPVGSKIIKAEGKGLLIPMGGKLNA